MEKRRKLPTLTKIGFGFGHILNDITATLWFGYGLVYMQVSGKFELEIRSFLKTKV